LPFLLSFSAILALHFYYITPTVNAQKMSVLPYLLAFFIGEQSGFKRCPIEYRKKTGAFSEFFLIFH